MPPSSLPVPPSPTHCATRRHPFPILLLPQFSTLRPEAYALQLPASQPPPCHARRTIRTAVRSDDNGGTPRRLPEEPPTRGRRRAEMLTSWRSEAEACYTLVVPGSSCSRRMSSISLVAVEIAALTRASFSRSTLPSCIFWPKSLPRPMRSWRISCISDAN